MMILVKIVVAERVKCFFEDARSGHDRFLFFKVFLDGARSLALCRASHLRSRRMPPLKKYVTIAGVGIAAEPCGWVCFIAGETNYGPTKSYH
jgi:hypothetical protein